jgi:hypothetical protein
MSDWIYSFSLVYVANNNSNDLLVTTSNDGVTWSKSRQITGQSSKLAPSILGVFQPQIEQYQMTLAYVANNNSNDLLVTTSTNGIVSSTDAITWSKPSHVTGQSSKLAPAISGFGNSLNFNLLLAYVANNNSNDLLVTSSTDGITWSKPSQITGQSSKLAPAIVEFVQSPDDNCKLILAYVANNSSNDLLVTSSTDGITWSKPSQITGQSSKLAPSIIEFIQSPDNNYKLILAYVANNSSNDLLVTSSTDGITWSKPSRVTGQCSQTAPALCMGTNYIDSENYLALVYVANNNSKDLLMTTSTDGIIWSKPSQITGQSSKLTPTLTFASERID